MKPLFYSIMFKSLSLVLFLSFSITVYSQDREKEIKQIKNDVEELAHKKYKGREAGTKGEKAAAKYIAKRYKEIGLTFAKKSDDYLQTFNFPKSKNPHTPCHLDPKPGRHGHRE